MNDSPELPPTKDANDALNAPASARRFNRRKLLVAGGVAAAGAAGVAAYPYVSRAARGRSSVFIASNQKYDGDLRKTIADGLIATGVDPAAFRGKRVLLKPNLVEPMRGSPQMTTHPAMVVACAEVFLAAGAEVKVGEAPGHMRDTEAALVESGLAPALIDAKLPFADLNYEESQFVRNASLASELTGFFLPRSVAEADLIVSMPKLKTHHWVGITVSMKNLYGTLPGNRYGWPKNVLHHAGIPQTVVDINATIPPAVAVVDGILCMEGDGPIMGAAKDMGLVIVGADRLAVDATCARIIGFEPARVSYMDLAHKHGFGQLHDMLISQRGERWGPLVKPFRVVERIRELQTREAGLLTS